MPNICILTSYLFPLDMETECYPCIPMQSASNQQKSMLKSQQTIGNVFGGETITIKNEPLSPANELNVVDDSEENNNVSRDQGIRISKSKGQQLISTNPQVHKLISSNGNNGSLLLTKQQQLQQTTVHFARVSQILDIQDRSCQWSNW